MEVRSERDERERSSFCVVKGSVWQTVDGGLKVLKLFDDDCRLVAMCTAPAKQTLKEVVNLFVCEVGCKTAPPTI